MAEATMQQQIKEITAMLTALTTTVETIANSQATDMARILKEIQNIAPHPRARTAAAATSKAAVSKVPRTFKAWFIAQYKDSETIRDKCKSMLSVVHAKKPYDAAKKENKPTKEAELMFEEINTVTTHGELLSEFKKMYETLRDTQMKDAGIEPAAEAAAAAAAAATTSEDEEVAAAPKKSAPKKKPTAPKKSGAVPKDIDG